MLGMKEKGEMTLGSPGKRTVRVEPLMAAVCNLGRIRAPTSMQG